MAVTAGMLNTSHIGYTDASTQESWQTDMSDFKFVPDYTMYANQFSFLGVPLCADISASSADLAILGVPYDLATSGRPGTRSGPTAIRQASANLRWEEARWPWSFNLADRLSAVDCGDVMYPFGDSPAFVAALEDTASEIVTSGKTLLSFGGDHFVALPLIRAHYPTYGPVALIHFDAHTDTDPDGGVYDHGAMFHHACEEGLLDEEHSVQVGIRTSYPVDDHPFTVLDADWVCSHEPSEVAARIIEIVGDRSAYVSFDIDCLDPAYAPGTGTPVVGGVSSNAALQIIRCLAPLNLIGMDIVEVSPAYDKSEITALAAATLGLEFMYLKASQL
jgi:agmatinase